MEERPSPITVGPLDDPDRYEILDTTPVPTESGQGAVFRGRTRADGDTVAIKQLFGVDAAAVTTIEDRLSHLLGVQHPNLAEHLEVFVGPPLDTEPAAPTEYDLVYVVSRWVPGPLLPDEYQAASAITRMRWVCEVAAAANFLHRWRPPGAPHGLIHRDIKPTNVIIDHGRAVVIDFGLLRPHTGEPTDTSSFSAAWMAPETVGYPDNASPRSDAWAVARLACWLLCDGQLPWRREPDSMRATLRAAALNHNLEDPSAIASHITRMLAEDPDRRPRLDQWARELERLVTSTRPRLRRPVLAAAALSVALSLALAAAVVDRDDSAKAAGETTTTDEAGRPTSPGTGPEGPDAVVREQQGTRGADTFSDPFRAVGRGPRVEPSTFVDIDCKVHAPQIESVNPDGYWYRLSSPPWNGEYFVAANTFWNGDIAGRRPYIHFTNFDVPDCPNTDVGNATLADIVTLVDASCAERLTEALDLRRRLTDELLSDTLPVEARVASGRIIVATLQDNRTVRTLPRPAHPPDRPIIDRFVATYFAGTAQLEAAVDALAVGDQGAAIANVAAGTQSLTDSMNIIVSLGATRCDTPG